MMPFKVNWAIAKHYIIIGIALLSFHALNKILSSEIDGEVVLFNKTEDGKLELGKLRVHKMAVEENQNLIELNQSSSGSREIIYKRKTASILGMDIFLGGGVETHKDGSESYKVGISISF